MSAGYVHVLSVPIPLERDTELSYISAWASALLVQSVMGNAKALKSGTSNRYRFPRFFYAYSRERKFVFITRPGESAGADTFQFMKKSILTCGLLFLLSTLLYAQELKVESFEKLERDLLARTSERLDLNDVPCAVLRVSVADAQSFTFAGNIIGDIVYQPGEAIVYLTDRTRKIRINSDKFGTLEYEFPERLSKSVVYKLSLSLIVPESKKTRTLVMPTVGIGKAMSYGVMVGIVRKWGGYVKAKYSFTSLSTDASANDAGIIEGTSSQAWYTGKDQSGRFSVTAGALYRVALPFYLYAGLGYGNKTLAWEMADGRWAEAADHTYKGLEAEVGAIYRFGNYAVSAGVETTQCQYWEANVGVAIMF